MAWRETSSLPLPPSSICIRRISSSMSRSVMTFFFLVVVVVVVFVVVFNGVRGNAEDGVEGGGLGDWIDIEVGTGVVVIVVIIAAAAVAVILETPPTDGTKGGASRTAHSAISGASRSTSNVSCHNGCSGTLEDGEMAMPCR